MDYELKNAKRFLAGYTPTNVTYFRRVVVDERFDKSELIKLVAISMAQAHQKEAEFDRQVAWTGKALNAMCCPPESLLVEELDEYVAGDGRCT